VVDAAFGAFAISHSGLRAQRIRIDTIANNIANINTTRTPQGGPFRRQMAIFAAEPLEPAPIEDGRGVDVPEIVPDMSPFKTVYDPGHPDADQNGYLLLPNIDVAVEMVDLVSASRSYEANVASISATKRILRKALEIIEP
jgi:flagellar basal-body rod protein FlgC